MKKYILVVILCMKLSGISESVAQEILLEIPDSYEECLSYLQSNDPISLKSLIVCRDSAELGLPDAQFGLGIFLSQDDETTAEALQWYQKAAAAGLPSANLVLARIYLSEEPAFLQPATTYLQRASCSGLTEAISTIEQFGLEDDIKDCSSNTRFDMIGTWEGHLTRTAPPESSGLTLRIELTDNAVRVFMSHDMIDWEEVKPGAFSYSQLYDSVIISALDSNSNLDRMWVESWTIHLQKLSPTEAEISLLRSVNNTYWPATFEYKTYTYLLLGKATRSLK